MLHLPPPFPMTEITSLSSDVTELILSYLPIPTLVRVSTVCKLWQSIISSTTFSATQIQTQTQSHPWFFLFGIHNTSSKNNQSFAFDPLSNRWLLLPSPTFPPHHHYSHSSFLGADGFFLITAPTFTYSRILKRSWRPTSPLHFSRINPLLGVFSSSSSSSASLLPNFIVVGGVRFIGNLVDIEDRLAVEIYNPDSDSWQLGPPLPADFRSGNSSQSLSSALFNGRFYVLDIYSFFVSSLDLHTNSWSVVQSLRSPGVVFSFLLACWDRLDTHQRNPVGLTIEKPKMIIERGFAVPRSRRKRLKIKKKEREVDPSLNIEERESGRNEDRHR